ncbi:MAG: response regulator [Clostridiales bacterium]|nr:response regulator [Clostridiales bacterium]
MKKQIKNKRDRSMFPIFIAVSLSFVLAIIVSISSLAFLARENSRDIDMMLTYRIYDIIASNLNEPIIVSKTMACDDFLADFLQNEDSFSEEQAVSVMKDYLSGVKGGLEYDSAFLVSEATHRYYSYEGLNKIVDPENDEHDVWYSLFVGKNVAYDLDVDNDEVNKGHWTVFVNARIEDGNGNLLGVCGVGVQMTNLQDLFARAEKEFDVKINLVDKNGLVQVDTDDINIENAWLDDEILTSEEANRYVTSTSSSNEFVVTKYVEYLGWYLVVRSEPSAIGSEFISLIIINIALFLLVMGILFLMIAAILRRRKKERDDRERLLILSERAVAASEAKSSFLSSMSHEIRTPINAVLGMNEMILRETDDKKILGYSTNIRSAGKTLLALINSILDFSKIEEGKMEIVPVTYDTATLVNNIVASVSERAKEKGLEFITDVDKNLPSRMVGDDVRVLQVIVNILTNAVKYTDEGHVRFIFREEKRNGEDIDLYVAVEDTGIGIRQEDMPKLFESFERLDKEKNHGIEGTGLGMAIVTNLLKMMGSKIQVQSEYGLGSTFYFVIRQKIADETPIGDYTKNPVVGLQSEEIELLRVESARVLVVDDNEMNLKVAKNLLGLFGIEPQLSSSGADAMECVKKEHYHLILLDHMMPKMDGKETLAKMKAEGILPSDTKVVALTANAINGAREEYLLSGFDDYLSKPIEIDNLEEILKTWLPEEIVMNGSTSEKDPSSASASGSVSDDSASGSSDDEILEFLPEEDDDSASSASSSPKDPVDVAKAPLTERLKSVGIDADKGLIYCAGDSAFYEEMLTDYVRAYDEKLEELDACYDAADWKGFEVKIHALKSISKTIGATALSEKAYTLEKAAGKGDADFIRKTYSAFADEYKKVVETIRGELG